MKFSLLISGALRWVVVVCVLATGLPDPANGQIKTLKDALTAEKVEKSAGPEKPEDTRKRLEQGLQEGRHTTTSHELVPLPGTGMLIDNPGMREIQMWTDEITLRDSFADVTALADQCKFADCSHRKDAKCAIRAAVDAGTLEVGRYENFLNLETEIAALRKRSEKRQMTVERWAKRNSVKARNLADRIQLEKDDRGDF